MREIAFSVFVAGRDTSLKYHMCSDGRKTSSFQTFYRPQTKFAARVMFLHLSVILFTVGGVVHPPRQTPHSWANTPPPEMATEAGTTHHTGMRSCCLIFLRLNYYLAKFREDVRNVLPVA